MRSRLRPALDKLILQPGFCMTRSEVAAALHCDPKTAYKLLDELWKNGELYIVRWRPARGAAIPVFKYRDARQTDAHASHREPLAKRDRSQEYAKNAFRRLAANPPRLGMFGI